VSASNDLIAVWALSKDSAELKFKLEQTEATEHICVSDNGDIAAHKGGFTMHLYTGNGANKDVRNL
jgi:hypothetical protein